MKRLIILNAIIVLILSACSLSGTNEKNDALTSLSKNNLILTDELVLKYINTYKALKDKGPSMLEAVNKSDGNPQADKQGFNDFENVIKANGFTSYAEFVRANAKIAWAFSIQQAGSFMEDMDNKKDAGLSQINEQLNNPDVPEEVKEQLRKAKEQITSAYDKNNKWADMSLDIVRNLVNEEDVAVINRHEQALLETFSGVSMPEVPENFGK